MRPILLIILLSLFLPLSFSSLLANIQDSSALPSTPLSPGDVEKIIAKLSFQVISALKDQNWPMVATCANPLQGVRFSSCQYIDMVNDLVFTPEQIEDFGDDQTIYYWGIYQGSGLPIELSPNDYYRQFIYDVDFADAFQINYNQSISIKGEKTNIFQVYPYSIIVEFYFPGIDPEVQGLDWRSLLLVFQQEDENWYLVGIVHCSWAI